MKKLLWLLILIPALAFGQDTDAELTTQADVIRNETTPGGNTRTRVADMFQGLIDSKVSLSGSYANPSWLTSLTWSKISSTPTTLAGYGITSPLPVAQGGTGLSSMGTSGQILRVNSGTTALEYFTSNFVSSTAGNNELPKSNGTNLTTSGVFSTSSATLTLGSSSLSGASRSISTDGSATNVGLSFVPKGQGSVTFQSNGGFVSFMIRGSDGYMAMSNANGFQVPDRLLHIKEINVTNGVGYPLKLAESGSSPAIGSGVGIEFETKTSATPTTKIGSVIESIATDVTGSSEDFDFVIKNMAGGAAAAERLRITSAGVVKFGTTPTTDNTNTKLLSVDGSNNTEAVDIISALTTPSPSCLTNCDATSGAFFDYVRISNLVIFTGRVAIDATATGTTTISIPIPIASNFNNTEDAGGTVSGLGGYGYMQADETNDVITIVVHATTTSNQSFFFSGKYEVK